MAPSWWEPHHRGASVIQQYHWASASLVDSVSVLCLRQSSNTSSTSSRVSFTPHFCTVIIHTYYTSSVPACASAQGAGLQVMKIASIASISTLRLLCKGRSCALCPSYGHLAHFINISFLHCRDPYLLDCQYPCTCVQQGVSECSRARANLEDDVARLDISCCHRGRAHVIIQNVVLAQAQRQRGQVALGFC